MKQEIPREIPQILRKYDIKPNILLDQNFMTDPTLIKKLVSSAGIKPGETVLEIGSGLGTVTRELARSARKVIAIDIEKAFRSALRETLSGSKNVEITTGNALKLISRLKFDKLVSNTPYSISEPLIHKLAACEFKLAVLTLPRNFVARLTAKPGSPGYSKLSMLAQSFFSVETLFPVPNKAFHPEPKVESAVVRLKPKKPKDTKAHMLRYLLLHPGMKLRNALREALTETDFTKNQARDAIAGARLSKSLLEKRINELTAREITLVLGKLVI